MTSTEPKVYKIISATSSADENGNIRTRSIKQARNGKIMIRTGDVGTRSSASMSSPRTMEENGTRYTEIVKGQQSNYASDDKEAQQAKNASYRQSSYKNYLTDDNQKAASHTIYTKHSTSSAMQQHDSHDQSFQAFSTRRVTTKTPSSAAGNSYETRPVSNNVRIDKEVTRKSGVISTDIPDGPTNSGNKQTLKEQTSNDGITFVGQPSPMKNKCFNCNKTVYPKEKIGPVMDAVYHQQCFKCASCGFKLTLTNFYHNHNDVSDRRVYCKSHQPVVESSKGGMEDTYIRSVINKPKVEHMDTNIRRSGDLTRVSSIDSTALNIRTAMNVPKLDTYNQTVRPVPALATSPPSEEHSNPTAYMYRQLKNAEFHSPPSPPRASEKITRL